MKDKAEQKKKATKTYPQSTFGYAPTAVMRALGKEGLSTAHVRDIFKARKIKASDSTLSIQVNAGRTKGFADRGEPAPLTQAQIKELTSAAPDPAKAEEKK